MIHFENNELDSIEHPLISLIVPVYNVEEYLIKSIKSIENQDYDNLEVIFVDDGSTDRSGEICEQYCNKHNNFSVIHQDNAGLSVARNVGVLKAKGEYISFADSDDIISFDYISYMYYLIKKHNADMSIARLRKTKIQESTNEPNKYSDFLISPSRALEMMCYGYKFSVTAVAKMYKKDCLLQYPYPQGKLYEDLATTYKIIDSCKKIAYGEKIVYFYFQRPNSIMNSKLDEKQLQGLDAANEQLEFIRKHYPEIEDAAKFHCVVKILDYMRQLLVVNAENRDMFNVLRERLTLYDKGLMRNKNVAMTTKIKYLSVRMGYSSTRIIFCLISRVR